jgi:hypothetical protein
MTFPPQTFKDLHDYLDNKNSEARNKLSGMVIYSAETAREVSTVVYEFYSSHHDDFEQGIGNKAGRGGKLSEEFNRYKKAASRACRDGRLEGILLPGDQSFGSSIKDLLSVTKALALAAEGKR